MTPTNLILLIIGIGLNFIAQYLYSKRNGIGFWRSPSLFFGVKLSPREYWFSRIGLAILFINVVIAAINVYQTITQAR